jgi:large subunit ribosomal protein L29
VPIIRLKDIKEMSAEERAKKVSDIRTELARLRTMVGAGGAVEDPSRIRELRKAVAQILTIEHEDKLGLRKKKEETAKKKGKKEKKTK